MVLRVVGANARQREQSRQRFRRIGLRQGAALPALGVLMLDRDTCGETDEPVFVAEMWPRLTDRRRVLSAVESLQLVPQSPILATSVGRGRCMRRGRFRPGVRDAIQPRLCPSAADSEI